ncbi:MAG TPA: RES family NAD+ phosphorylase [Blastocatellia bacterium]|nr:RES family NAD+ phosphorylase [Blastocatellia bacterium]
MKEKNAHRLLPYLRPLTGVWYRAIQTRFIATALHFSSTASRFNPGGTFPLLYLSENHLVALLEVQALFGSPLNASGLIPSPRHSYTVLNLTVNLAGVADLTSHKSQTDLETNPQELTGDWIGYQIRSLLTSVRAVPGPAPTQQLGNEINTLADIEAFCTLSAKAPDQMNLVIYPDKLRPGSFIEFFNPTTGKTERLISDPLTGKAAIV